MAHEIGSLRKMNDVTKADIKWIRRFDKDVTRRRDPISSYLKRARRYARRRRIKRYVTVAAIIALIIMAVIIFFLVRK
jgi:t-SNARE complex subunit (syntaxin)